MTSDEPAVLAPPLPFTLTAGDVSVRLSLKLWRRRVWFLVAILAFGAVAAIATRDIRAAIMPVCLVAFALLVAGATLLYQRAFRHATITVTATEIEIRGVRRHEVMARHEINALVVGWFTTQVEPTTVQVALVDHEGRRRLTLQAYAWPEGGLEQVAAALDVPMRLQDGGDKRLVPAYWRHLLWTIIVGAVAFWAVVIGVAVVKDHVQASNRDQAAKAVRRDFERYATERLTGSQVPGLEGVGARSSADEEPYLSVDVELTTKGEEADPAAVRAAQEAVCGFAPDLDGTALDGMTLDVTSEVTSTLTSTPLDKAGDHARRSVTLECTAPQGLTGALLAWVEHAAAQPVGPRVRLLSADSRLADVDLFVILATSDVADFTAVADQICGFEPPGGQTLDASLTSADSDSYSSGDVELDCDDRPAMLAAWQGSGP